MNEEIIEYSEELSQYNKKESDRYNLISRLLNMDVELSYSWLKEMLKSPKHFLNYKLKDYTPPTEGMVFGSMVDCLITEPNNFDKNFVIIEKAPVSENQIKFCNAIISGSTKQEAFNLAYKRGNSEDIYKEFESYINAVISNKTTTTYDKYIEAKEVSENLLKDSSIQLFIDSCNSFQEKTIVKYEGWNIKRFTDLKGQGLTIDLKLMSQLNPDIVDREIFKMDYDLQSGIYTIDNLDRYFNICYDRKGNSIITEYDESTINYELLFIKT